MSERWIIVDILSYYGSKFSMLIFFICGIELIIF